MLTFRKAEQADIATLRSLAEKIWHAYYPPIVGVAQVEYMLPMMYGEQVIRREIEDGVRWELSLQDGEPVGFLSVTAEADQRAKLNKLYLLPEFHGVGHGQELIKRALEVAATLGAREIWLQVNKRNERAFRAYLRAGFTVQKEAVFDIGNGFVMDDFILSRVVP